MSDAAVRRTVLRNGTRVVSETVPGARSVSAGVWVGVGSRDEPREVAGASHFLEHLLFKGTKKRTGRELAIAVDAVGGDLNAYTAKEHTVFYLRFPAHAAATGLDLLVELLTAPRLSTRDIAAEREIILEELASAEDNPEDVVEQILWDGLFPEHPLGWEVIGSEATVRSMTRAQVAGFFDAWYRPANLVVAAAGAIEHEQLVAVAARLDRRRGGVTPTRIAPTADVIPIRIAKRDIEQVHLAFGWRGVPLHDDDRFAMEVLEQVLGGGPSSRLFQEVREERSLAYSVYASSTEYVDAGGLTVVLATMARRVPEALAVVDCIVGDLVANGVTSEELTVAKGFLEGSMWLSLEDTAGRLGRIGWSELTYGDVSPPEKYVERIMALTLADVHRVARRVLGPKRTLAAVGPVRADQLLTG